MPIYMPRDEVIPAKEVPAAANFTRGFAAGHEVLQRERKRGVPGALTVGAYLTVLAVALGLIALIAWSLVCGPRRGPLGPGGQDSQGAGRTRVNRTKETGDTRRDIW
jgi:hypothetical protein